MYRTKDPTVEELLHALIQDAQDPRPTFLAVLADLNRQEEAVVRRLWPQVEVERRVRVTRRLVEQAEDDFELSFREFFYCCLEDPEPRVRALAVDGLWEDDSRRLCRRLLALLREDPAPLVRAAAATSLGRYVYRAEVGELPEGMGRELRDALMEAWRRDPDAEVRRRALEAVAYLADEEIHGAIEAAYRQPGRMRESALFAMGRTMDPRWLATVRRELSSPDPALRYEAARAAGEMAARTLVLDLLPLLEDRDDQVAMAAAWALGEIGGRQALKGLERVLERVGEGVRVAVEEAIAKIRAFEDPLALEGF